MNDNLKFPKVKASATKSKFGGAALFTVDGSYGPFDATAPGMTPEVALLRAEFAAHAINAYPALKAIAEFAGIIARGACLLQTNQSRCICYRCECERLVTRYANLTK